MVTVF